MSGLFGSSSSTEPSQLGFGFEFPPSGFASFPSTAAAPLFSTPSSQLAFATPSTSSSSSSSQSGTASGERISLFATPPNSASSSIGVSGSSFGFSNNNPIPNSAAAANSTLFRFPGASTSSTPNIILDTMADLKRQISYLSGYVVVFKEQNPTNIQLKPNDDGPCIPAHRAILEARCKIYKAPPSDDDDIVTMSELNTEELMSFLEFLYTGNLPPIDKLEKHVYSLYVAAKNYEISDLEKLCERYMLSSLSTSNAVRILELSDAHSNKSTFKETSLKFVAENMKDIVGSKEYEDLARANPDLSVEITRAFVTKASTDAQGFRSSKIIDMRPMTSNQLPPRFDPQSSLFSMSNVRPFCC